MNPNIYATTYSRAKTWYANNVATARFLDADDWAFIEHVRQCGIANGELPYTNSFVLQELDYWHMPYWIDYSVHRRVGSRKEKSQKFMIPDADAVSRKAQRVRAKADREAAKQAMKEEWDRQKRDLEKERQERLRRTMEADIEWDRDHEREFSNLHEAPESFAEYTNRKARASGLPLRHYIPHWKLEEMETPKQKQRRQKLEAVKAVEKKKRKEDHARLQKIAQQIEAEQRWAERQNTIHA